MHVAGTVVDKLYDEQFMLNCDEKQAHVNWPAVLYNKVGWCWIIDQGTGFCVQSFADLQDIQSFSYMLLISANTGWEWEQVMVVWWLLILLPDEKLAYLIFYSYFPQGIY